jgi:hypothetical protein
MAPLFPQDRLIGDGNLMGSGELVANGVTCSDAEVCSEGWRDNSRSKWHHIL